MTEVKVNGLAGLQAFLLLLPAKVEAKILRGALRAGAAVVRDEARELVVRKSGQLAKGLAVGSKLKNGQVTGYVKAKGKHGYLALWFEYGVKPHSLEPKAKSGKKVLKFEGVYRKSAQHPGIEPKPFLRPAMDTKAQDALKAVGEYIKARLTKEGMTGIDQVDLEEE